MSSLRPAGLGPIVGHTTHRSCRLWIRATDPADKGAELADDRRTIGVLSVIAEAGKDLPLDTRPVFYFRLRREYDRTGTFNLGLERSLGEKGDPFPLIPNTEYRVRMGPSRSTIPSPMTWIFPRQSWQSACRPRLCGERTAIGSHPNAPRPSFAPSAWRRSSSRR